MIDLIVDLQYGSTGKGLIAGYLAEKNEPMYVVNCNMPNAGHTYIDSKGNKMIFKVLPNGIVSPRLRYVMLGPGSVINVDRLKEEIEVARGFGYLGPEVQIIIHPNAVFLDPMHRIQEEQTLSGISSTMQGSAVASIEKMMRRTDKPIVAKDSLLPDFIEGVVVADHQLWYGLVTGTLHNRTQAEGSQGFSLGINQRFYPYCTSRDCTPQRMIADMGLAWRHVNVIGTLRTFPIRVGNTPDGYSGDVYPDQEELSWEQLGVDKEFTTVTGRERRVFTFSDLQLQEALTYCQPDEIFLNFMNYLGTEELKRVMLDKVEYYCNWTNTAKLKYLGYGPAYQDVVEQ